MDSSLRWFFQRAPLPRTGALLACIGTLARIIVLGAVLTGGIGVPAAQAAEASATRIDRVDFQGWKNAWRLSNSEVEVIAVPQVGRIIETLGPLVRMSPGDRIHHTTTYTLLRRMTTDADAEARRVLGL